MRKSIMPLVLISLALLFTSCSAKSAISPDAVLEYCEENDCKETDLNYILMCDKGYADYFLYDDRYCMGFSVYIDDYSGDDVTTRLDYLKKICKKLDVPSPWKIAKDELQEVYEERGGYYLKY